MAVQTTKITFTTNDLMSAPQAAKQLGVHFTTIYRWIRKGEIHPFYIAGQMFVSVDEVNTLQSQRLAQTHP